ncbi:SpoIIE family protein phosphatase [Streptomyces nigrescens]|uniref:SpoIIE family protein phosphatase n=1 Tax=Streptomyces nigrescens TaxID=1920 RepID=A0ABY7JHS0_STRNI|nr:SpoIIE family protein phosphatase [Streptomyces nigrescens]WAU09532.1 SpoIIE family protein phosphatase [Streptomyces nigrescens]
MFWSETRGANFSIGRAREHFLQGDPVEAGVRSPILTSWERCRLMGLSPDQSDPPYWQGLDVDGRLVRAAEPVLDRLQSVLSGSSARVSLTDERGAVLLRRFGEASMVRELPPIHSRPGFVFAERFTGTNAISLAIEERRLCHVQGAEHFAECYQSSACAGIPIRNPLNGHIEGVLAGACSRSDTHPPMGSLIRKAAEAVERRLLEQSAARERALLQAYLDVKASVQTGEVAGGGHLIGMEELSHYGVNPSDHVILVEKAAELISLGQKAAVEVLVSRGRRLTLLSRSVTTPSRVEGVVIEVLLPHDWSQQGLALPYLADEPRRLPAHPAPPRGPLNGAATSRSDALSPTPGARGTSDSGDGLVSRLMLVGEPEVGKYALAARRRLEVLAEASTRIGTTLDVSRTAWELAETAVPRLADFVTIDLPEAVLRGEESADPGTDLHRTVVHGIREDCPFYPVGERVDLRPRTPHMRCLASGQVVLEPDLRSAAGWIAQDPEHAERLLACNVHSLISVPLLARGVVLGIASFYRSQEPAPFGDDDCSLAQELAARAALCMDNARRYTREHTLALSLQRSLLPRGLPEQDAVEVAHRYLPAESGVGGDWFDVIPLSGTRVALLVGDVVGHGLHAAATMGRLRTAARNFAELELAPDELLTHLDNLLVRLDREEGGDNAGFGSASMVGATCLYAIYDPTSRQCTMARAGHPPPALVLPDGTVTFPELPAGPPLGLGGLPFETAAVQLPEHSQLILYTDGLIEDRDRDIDEALDCLRDALAHPGTTPEDTCDAVMHAVAPEHPGDDIALLVARTHAMPPDRIASWELPADPARVSDVRAAAIRRLSQWGLDGVAFAVELLLSELVTNAIRYGAEPIQVRLIHDRTLICEVSDTSSTAPRMRLAASTDEGGRGLFLVAQLAQSWGTRYTTDGKVIWAECALDVPEGHPGTTGL